MALVVAMRGDPGDNRIDGWNAALSANLGPQSCGCLTSERQKRAASASQEARRVNMRAIVIAAVVAMGIGVVSAAPSFAAPASGTAIVKAAPVGHVVKKAHWRHYCRHHHCYRRWR
jgi:hypothetical protein